MKAGLVHAAGSKQLQRQAELRQHSRANARTKPAVRRFSNLLRALQRVTAHQMCKKKASMLISVASSYGSPEPQPRGRRREAPARKDTTGDLRLLSRSRSLSLCRWRKSQSFRRVCVCVCVCVRVCAPGLGTRCVVCARLWVRLLRLLPRPFPPHAQACALGSPGLHQAGAKPKVRMAA